MHTGKSEVQVHPKCAALFGMLGHHHGLTDFPNLTDLCWRRDECEENVPDSLGECCASPKAFTVPDKPQHTHSIKAHTLNYCMAPAHGHELGHGAGRPALFI